MCWILSPVMCRSLISVRSVGKIGPLVRPSLLKIAASKFASGNTTAILMLS